jgi:plasmid stabilization system protein ParE
VGQDQGQAVSVPAVYLPEAEADIQAAYDAYERAQPGLGDRFADAVRDRIDLIRQYPGLYAVSRRDVRAAPVPGFPHVVYYRDRGADVLIVAVQHGRRSSRHWRGRAP